MSLADLLLGRRDPWRARADMVLGIDAARLAFAPELEVCAAAIVFDPRGKPHGFGSLAASVADDIGATLASREDRFGLAWLGLSGAGLDDLALSLGVLAQALERAGCWEQVVCAVFRFRNEHDPAANVHWIYNFERGTFYPFVSRADACRDPEEERRLMAAAAHDLRLERDPGRRYPVWDILV